jgi:proteasome lid subunit RPN8/RPN11
MNLQINEQALTHIHDHALADYPNECCGFLYGENMPARQISLIRKVKNVKQGDQRRRFEISPLDYLAAENYALENNLELLGIYHSHPNHPARPSEHDRVQAVEVFSYIITSVTEDKINDTTSWRLTGDKQFKEEQLNILKTINN